MFNELLFIGHSVLISCVLLGMLMLGEQALVAFICVQCLLANIFVVKQITLFGFTATSSDAFTIGATLGLNMLQEYYGRAIAKKAIMINFFLLMVYVVFSHIHLMYIPAEVDYMQQYFVPLLSLMPRIVIASFMVYLFVQYIDYLLYGFLKQRFQERFLVIRNYSSIVVCQFIDTVFFSFFGLYGIVDNIFHIIFISYAIKLASILIATPFVAFSRLVIKK